MLVESVDVSRIKKISGIIVEVPKQNRNSSNDPRGSNGRGYKDENHVQDLPTQRAAEGVPVGLIENNLLEYLEGTHMFETTAKGVTVLKMHSKICELLQTKAREG